MLLSLVMCGTMVFGGAGAVFADGGAKDAAKSEQNFAARDGSRQAATPQESAKQAAEQEKAKSKKGIAPESITPTDPPVGAWAPPTPLDVFTYTGTGSWSVSGTIGIDNKVTGTFDSGYYYGEDEPDWQAFDFYGRAYSITLQASKGYVINYTSEDFDPYLYLVDSRGNLIDENDDGAGNFGSKISYATDSSSGGTYYLIATNYSGIDTDGWESYMGGSFDLSISEATLGSISGTVTEAGSTPGTPSTPLKNITVYVYKGTPYTYEGTTEWDWYWYDYTETDASGKYQFTAVEEGQYFIEFFDDTYNKYITEYYDNKYRRDDATPITLQSGSMTQSNINAALEEGGSISGRVTGNGVPLGSVEVTAYSPEGYANYAYTDEDGYYTIIKMPSGRYDVECYPPSSSGYLWKSYSDDYSVNVTASNTTRNINFNLTEKGGTISGRVTNTLGQAMPDAYVRLLRYGYDGDDGWGWWYWYSTWTDEYGQYSFTRIETGQYRLYFESEDEIFSGYYTSSGLLSPSIDNAYIFYVTSGTNPSNLSVSIVMGATASVPPPPSYGTPPPGAGVATATAENVTAIRTPFTTLYMKKGTSLAPPVCADSIDASGKASTAATLSYASSNAKVATVDAKGKIKAKKVGKAVITATAANGKALKIKVNVVAKAKALKKFTLAKAPKTMKPGKAAQLKIKLTPAAATNLKVSFKSSKKGVATVDKAGKITAIKKGKTKITVKVGSKKIVLNITVK